VVRLRLNGIIKTKWFHPMFWVHEYRKLLLSSKIQRAQQMRLWETKSRFRITWSLDKMGFL